jgi:tetratricopeptide (TPR) repeat protein
MILDKDYYRILGVPRSATREEVTRAYKRLAAKYHPDKHHTNPLYELAEEKFKEINEAYHAIVGGEYVYTPSRKRPACKPDEELNQDAKEHLFRGISLFNAGNFKGAIKQFENALKRSESPMLYNLLGLACCETGDYKRAVEPLIKATQLDEENGKYYLDAGHALYKLGLWEKAIDLLIDSYNLLKEDRRLGGCCVFLAICNYHLSRYSRTEFFLEEAVNYDPDNPSYRVLLDEFRGFLGNPSSGRWKHRFTFTSRLEDSLGNLFHTIFSK